MKNWTRLGFYEIQGLGLEFPSDGVRNLCFTFKTLEKELSCAMNKKRCSLVLAALIWLSQEALYPEALNDFLDAHDVFTSAVHLVAF